MTPDRLPTVAAAVIFSLIAALAALSFAGPASVPEAAGPEPFEFSAVSGRLELAPHMETLVDPSGTLGLTDILSPQHASGFKPYHSDVYALRDTRAAHWLRFRLTFGRTHDPGHEAENLLVIGRNFPVILEYADVYLPGAKQGDYLHRASGALRPSRPGEIPDVDYAFRLPREISGKYVYVRLKTSYQTRVPLTVWTMDAFHRSRLSQTLAFGAIYGVFLSMILYNFFIYLSLRDKAYLFYVLYIASGLLWQVWLHGHSKLVFGLHPGLDIKLLWVFMGGTLFFGVGFGRSFLATARNTPRLDLPLKFLMICGAPVAVAGVLGFSQTAFWISHAGGLATALLLIFTAIKILRQGYRPAFYFMAAWLLLLLGSIVFALMGVRVLPVNAFTAYSLVLGMTAESLLLSFALAYRIRLLQKEKTVLTDSRRRLQKLSQTDSLTSLYNRGYLLSKLTSEIEHAHRVGLPLSFILLDVDDFKRFNDRFGHFEGDKVLVALADIMRGSARDTDSLCRYGGEEFALILPGTEIENAVLVGERIRASFAGLEFHPGPGKEPVRVTISLGVAQLRPMEDAGGIIRRADEAMYSVKNNGKNQVACAA